MSQKAIELADKDGDTKLSAAELVALPGLAWSLQALDTDQDKQLSQQEIQERLKLYAQLKTGLKSFPLVITYKGRPLPNAEVKLIPEVFVGEVLKPASGRTDANGTVVPAIAGQERDPCMQIGFYRIEVTSPDVRIAEKYNTATTLGVEVAPVTDPTRSGVPRLDVGKK